MMLPTRRFSACLLTLALALCAAVAAAADSAPEYRIDYRVAFLPAEGQAAVELRVTPGEGRPISFDFRMPESRYSAVEGDGDIERAEGRTLWTVPEKGGRFAYRYRIDRKRNGRGYDARITDTWAILRGDQLVPPAFVRSTPYATARATLRFELPEGWISAETGYLPGEAAHSFVIDNAGRRFQRPVGWIVAGDLGVRRERVEGMSLVVAAPKGESLRRFDILSILTATAPEMRLAFGTLPDKLLIVGAGDPMWRGGLSGPNTLYMHADRPMIGEDGTSTLLHELTHTLTRIRGKRGHDWIAEGFAEFYSIELLRRSGLNSDSRVERTLAGLKRRGRKVETLLARHSSGARTARAVVLLHELDQELRERSGGERSLDDVTQRLMRKRVVDTEDVIAAAERALGEPLEVLDTDLLR